jgi:hypothetical protein
MVELSIPGLDPDRLHPQHLARGFARKPVEISRCVFEGELSGEVIRNDRTALPRRDARHDQPTRSISVLRRRTKPISRRENSDGTKPIFGSGARDRTKPISPDEIRDGTKPIFGSGARDRTKPISPDEIRDRTKPISPDEIRDRTKPIRPPMWSARIC